MTAATMRARADAWVAIGLGVGLFVAYNANGREIGSYDSQPNKFAARELVLRHTLTLNHVVGAAPALSERAAFVVDRQARYRSAYSPVSSILAAAIAWPLWKTGAVDLRAPLAANLVAKLSASLVTALAVVIAYLTARQRLTVTRAVLVAVGLGLGTGFWYAVSQTLWEHETAVLGLAIAMLAFAQPEPHLTLSSATVTAVGLALAGAARPQLAPVIAVVLAGVYARARLRDALLATAIIAVAAGALIAVYYHWFGHPLGALALNEAADNALHGTSKRYAFAVKSLAGLIVSPNRGLLVFSPIVIVAAGGLAAAVADGWRSALLWCALAALAHWLLYGSYAVWWAGHTYGPRYMLDVLPLLVPLAAAGLARDRMVTVVRGIVALAFAWSIAVAATGAFCYPNDAWNTDPVDVDRNHDRLWSWSDLQIVRCWQRGLSPQNFTLFDRSAFRNEGTR